MRELVRTNDIVLVSAVGALLDGANIHHLVLDQNMSIIEGSLGVLPRRILVHEDDDREAGRADAGAEFNHVIAGARRRRRGQQHGVMAGAVTRSRLPQAQSPAEKCILGQFARGSHRISHRRAIRGRGLHR